MKRKNGSAVSVGGGVLIDETDVTAVQKDTERKKRIFVAMQKTSLCEI